MYPWIRKWDLDVRDGGLSRRLEKRTIRQLAKGQVTRANCRISKSGRWSSILAGALNGAVVSICMAAE